MNLHQKKKNIQWPGTKPIGSAEQTVVWDKSVQMPWQTSVFLPAVRNSVNENSKKGLEVIVFFGSTGL